MEPSTKIPAIEAAILETLDGAEGLEGVVVTDDREPNNEHEYVWLLSANAKRDFVGLGRRVPHLDEKISVTLRAVAIRGETIREAKARALEIAAAVESALRLNLKLDGEALQHRVEELDLARFDFDGQPGCHVLMTVVAKARIRNS